MSQFPSSGPVTLRTNLADSAITRALKSGEIASDLVRFDFCGPAAAFEGFKPMVRDAAFDAGELAIATFLQARTYGKKLSLLPAVMSGRFQHDCISYNARAGELAPKDIEGRRVAVRSYTQTTGLWVRGILQHDYGVDPGRVTWLTTEEAHLAEYRDPPNVERLPPGSKIDRMLLDGEVDAAVLGLSYVPKAPHIRTLIADPKAAALAWYEKNRAMPINHLFVVNSDLARERPDVVAEIYRMLRASKAAAPAPAGLDELPFGFEENRRALEIGMTYAVEQKLIPHAFPIDELYADARRALGA